MDLSTVKGISVRPFDTSHSEGRYLVCLDGRYYEVSRSVAVLLDTVRECSSLSEVAVLLSRRTGRRYSESEIEAVLQQFIRKTTGTEERLAKKKSPFIVNIGLLPPETVRRVADWLKFLFTIPIVLPVICLLLICEILFFTRDLGVIRTLSGADGWTVALVLGLFILNSMFHEFGHAAACRHFGADNGGVGFGLYISFPVFYTDVSDIWRLTRRQRVVVNLGGVYFQLVFLVPFFIWYFITGSDICKLYIYATNVNFLFTLNPFLKFDGYWIMSDIIGVPNLRSRTTEYIGYIVKKLKKQKVGKPFMFSVRPVEKAFMIIYSLAVNIFFLYFFVYMMPTMLYSYVRQLPGNLKHIVNSFAGGIMPDASILAGSVIQIFFICFMLLFIYRLCVKVLGSMTK